ncbi:MAG: carboxypeptidase-like regulatory domain-containing protein [Gemmatimonadales bacterium]
MPSMRGTVRDTAGRPIAGAEVAIANKRVTTNSQGVFRVDSLRPGSYVLTIRLVGYVPVSSRIQLSAEPFHAEYILLPAAHVLPEVVVEARKTGISGIVGNSAYRPLPGAKVTVAGIRGGEMLTDSAGRFAFPAADQGLYLVRVTLAGYAERRLFVELRKGEGKELAVRIVPSMRSLTRADEVAAIDLGRRLAVNLPRERLAANDLKRYGSLGMCDVNRITEQVGRGPAARVIVILNGFVLDTALAVSTLCLWRADEVELVEFGSHVCRDITRTIPDLVDAWCTRIPPSGRPPSAAGRDLYGGGRVRTQGAGGPFVVIWERRQPAEALYFSQ